MPYLSFTPRFTKEADTPDGRKIITITKEVLDSIISTIIKDDDFYCLLQRYAKLVRKELPDIDSDNEIEMRKIIIPRIYNILVEYNSYYSIFTADVEEEIYRRFDSES